MYSARQPHQDTLALLHLMSRALGYTSQSCSQDAPNVTANGLTHPHPWHVTYVPYLCVAASGHTVLRLR
jgi:hypothetical protein